MVPRDIHHCLLGFGRGISLVVVVVVVVGTTRTLGILTLVDRDHVLVHNDSHNHGLLVISVIIIVIIVQLHSFCPR